MPELCWRSAVELQGEGSEPALEAQLAAAQARERAGDMAGALALAGAENPRAGGAVLIARDMLARLRAQVHGSQVRPLPSIHDCDCTA